MTDACPSHAPRREKNRDAGRGTVGSSTDRASLCFGLSRLSDGEFGGRQARNMTCVDVMYQPYTPYFPYQRPGPSVVGSLDHLKVGLLGSIIGPSPPNPSTG